MDGLSALRAMGWVAGTVTDMAARVERRVTLIAAHCALQRQEDRMKIVVAVVASVMTFGGLALASHLSPAADHLDEITSRLEVPPPGEVAPALLVDGEPVFVVSHRPIDGGGVSVVSALSPYQDTPVVWCTSDRSFWEPGPASRFDEEGSFAGGPAPEGLVTFEVAVEEPEQAGAPSIAVVGERRPAQPRHRPPLRPTGPTCEWEVENLLTADGSTPTNPAQPPFRMVERMPDAVGHDLDELYGPPVAPAEADRPNRWAPRERQRFVRMQGRLLFAENGEMQLCELPPASGGEAKVPSVQSAAGCVRAVSLYAESARRTLADLSCVGHLEGEILARVTAAGLADVAVFPPFTGVGEAFSARTDDGTYLGYSGHNQHLDCEGQWSGLSVAGRLVAVEPAEQPTSDEAPEWVAVLDEPAEPFGSDARQESRPAREDIGSSARWPVAPEATFYVYPFVEPFEPDLPDPWEGVGIDAPGRRTPRQAFTAAEIAQLLDTGQLPRPRRYADMEASLDPRGRITSASIDE